MKRRSFFKSLAALVALPALGFPKNKKNVSPLFKHLSKEPISGKPEWHGPGIIDKHDFMVGDIIVNPKSTVAIITAKLTMVTEQKVRYNLVLAKKSILSFEAYHKTLIKNGWRIIGSSFE